MTDQEIVSALVALRVEQGLTQKQLSERMGVCRPTVARFETDVKARRRLPSLWVLQRYAAAVGAEFKVVPL